MANLVALDHVPSAPPLSVRAGDLCARVRSFGVELALIPIANGVVLEGISPTFYGKQMAQELARQARFIVVANRIQVDPIAAAVTSYERDD